MMSTLDSSVYRRHRDSSPETQVRPVVVGAPYVLCVFTVGVILMGVGTFLTSQAYEKDPPDTLLLALGPGLLGLGGLLLLGSVLVCVVACCKNRHIREALSDELLNIGGSTFYGGRGFVQLEEETQLHDRPPKHHLHNSALGGVTNPAGPDHDAIMILANTVAEERERQRKSSRKYSRNLSQDPLQCVDVPGYSKYYLGPQRHSRDDIDLLDHLGLERLRRANAYPELAEDFDLGDPDMSSSAVRERAYSMSVRGSPAQLTPVQQRLRRNVTFASAYQATLQHQQEQLQFLRQQEQQMRKNLLLKEQQSSFKRKRSSKRKKGILSREESTEGIKVHYLPQYNPDLLSAVGIQPKHPQLERVASDQDRRDPNRKEHWKNEVNHGSLGNPRRRPSVVMGVKGFRPQHSGSSYRHHSIYASDMDLHRIHTVASEGHSDSTSEYRQEPQTLHKLSKSDTEDQYQRSSPEIRRPFRPNEGSLSSLNRQDTKRDDLTLPRSSSTSPSLGRPLSNISSESCCSECCRSGHDGSACEATGHTHDQQVENGPEKMK